MSVPTRFVLVAVILGALLVACAPPPPPPTDPPEPSSPTLPDLVLVDIILKPKPPNYGYADDVIINTLVRNNGAATTQGFVVWCSFTCDGNPTFFSGMQATNGLGSNQEITLGDDSLLSLSSCAFESQREFTCTADGDTLVTESDEANNVLTEILLTGR